MKKVKIIGVFVIMVLSVLCHFLYEWNNNFIFSILFPVNESIFEHMKLIATPVFLYGIFEYFYYKKKNIIFNNLLLSLSVSIILGIIVYLIPYLIIDKFIGHNMIVSISLLFLNYCFIEYLSYKIINYREIKYSSYIGVALLFLIILRLLICFMIVRIKFMELKTELFVQYFLYFNNFMFIWIN